ncbi:MAG: UDP-N-acetylglucosamine 1-carboxyvinyltransferase [Patescibacteria group bacterium]|jgi:UDP-N-acetylglucosamine 1-carboxyvinyltransferase
MTQLTVQGKARLRGEIPISGAKNAALKIIPAAILAKSESIIHNVPRISDVERMEDILQSIGTDVLTNDRTITINPAGINSAHPDPKLMKKLRGSIVTIGPLLAKFGKASFSQPGGCLIGARPIDDHLDVFSQLGVKIKQRGEDYFLDGKPKAGNVVLSKMSVTATENAIMASVLSPGTTRISVAAAEPEIADLAKYLNRMGAKISGAGTHDIQVDGVKELHGVEHNVLPDRIEAGTYIVAAIAGNWEITIGPLVPEHLAIVLRKLELMGANFDVVQRSGLYYVQTKKRNKLRPINIDTRTYPGFPTDLQSPFAVLLTQAEGESRIFETIFEGRFLYLSELEKMGAKYEQLSPHIVNVSGPTQYKGKKINCPDIRGGVALVLAALIADGETTIGQCDYVDRGYELIDNKLQAVGAKINRTE